MTTATTKNFISKDNRLYKARVKFVDEFVNGIVEKVGYEQIKVGSKWQNLTERGRYIKTNTLLCTFVDHKSPLKKSFKEGKRYQVSMNASLGLNAGYIYDEDGDAWQLNRDDEVGFDVGYGLYKFEAQYK